MSLLNVIVLCKLQIACLLLTIFIGILYFSSPRQKNKLQRSFGLILISLPAYLLFDIATVWTVNNIEIAYKANDICHRFFFITLILTAFLFCNHMNHLIEMEEGVSWHEKISGVIMPVVLVFSSGYSLLAKPDYDFSDITGFATASFAGGSFVAVGIYIFLIIILLVFHWNLLRRKKRLAITAALVIEAIGLYFQIVHTELLLSGFVLTMMMVAFYLTLDNPDAILLAQVAEEKEKAERANASKSAFISVVSHEIRTPMNAVVGMTDLLLRDKESLNAKQEKYLNNIKNSGSALVMIVNDILDQSKIEAGKMEIVEDGYEIRSIVADVKMIIENRIGDKPVHLMTDISDDIPQFLVGDGLRIRQILINLMNNAVKFTEEGFIQLSITCEEKEDNRVKLKFSIRDSGMGIKPEDLGRLGEAFTQVDTQNNHEKEGTGLGLSISRDFISMMGGNLQVESEYGKGSEFFFSLWQGLLREEEADGEAGCSKLKANENFTAPEAKILIVDDTVINLMITEELLSPIQASVDTAESGKQALEKVREETYNVIFMDYMMPGMDGVETTTRIRELATTDGIDEERSQYYRSVPIITLSGDTSDETMERFKLAGVDDFTEKPVELKRLKKLLIKWLPEEMIVPGEE